MFSGCVLQSDDVMRNEQCRSDERERPILLMVTITITRRDEKEGMVENTWDMIALKGMLVWITIMKSISHECLSRPACLR